MSPPTHIPTLATPAYLAAHTIYLCTPVAEEDKYAIVEIEIRIGNNFHIWRKVLFNDYITIGIAEKNDTHQRINSQTPARPTDWRQSGWR